MRTQQNRKGRKGFTLIELIFSIGVLIIITAITLKSFYNEQKDEELKKEVNKIVFATKTYVLNMTIGYINGTGGYCSDDNTFKDITAVRSLKCAGFVGKPFNYNGEDDDKNDFINIPMRLLTTTYINVKTKDDRTKKEKTGCRLLYKTDSSDTKILYVGIDCHYIPNRRKRYMIENMLSTAFQESFPSLYEETYFRGIPWSSLDGGTKDDGKLIIKLKE